MSRAEILLTTALALIGIGVAAGQGFEVNGWVLLFWGMAIVVTIYGLVTRHGEDSGGLDLSDVPMPHRPGSGFERLGALAGAALRGDDVTEAKIKLSQTNEPPQPPAQLVPVPPSSFEAVMAAGKEALRRSALVPGTTQKPNIVLLEPMQRFVARYQSGRFHDSGGPRYAMSALVLPVRNEQLEHRAVATTTVRARIDYRAGVPAKIVEHVNYGQWLGAMYNHVELKPGDTAELILAVYKDGVHAVNDPHESRYTPEPAMRPLAGSEFDVDVVLFDSHGKSVSTSKYIMAYNRGAFIVPRV